MSKAGLFSRVAPFVPAVLAALMLLWASSQTLADTTFVDISPSATTSLFNDGNGGWSNEGINDLYMYPPLPTGEFSRNGYRFRISSDEDTGGKSVIMLKGQKLRNLPQQVEVKVPSARGRFVYFLQNYVHSVAAPSENYVIATYSINYADGTSEQIPMRDRIELQPWWTGLWYHNAGASAWPIIMGRNAVSSKWNQFIGAWATQWKNPHPDKPIASITFRSEGLASPAILAVTISDDDYFNSPNVKDDYKRPADVPADYFRPKLAVIQEQMFAEMVKAGWAKGVRQVDLIRPDILAVTIDSSVSRGPELGNDDAAKLQVPDAFEITSDGDPAFNTPVRPVKVGRQSYEYWNGDIGSFKQNRLYWHTYYLFLPRPITSGKSYNIKVSKLSDEFTNQIAFDYDVATTITPVIKVNQVAYTTLAKKRYAYLGWWAGDAGTVQFPQASAFRVIDEATNLVALQGRITVREANDELSGEEVRQLDLAALKPGRYHIEIPGLGRSSSFDVGGQGIRDLYFHTNRAFYHQRCGHELAQPYTDFLKPACHLEAYESGFLVSPWYKPKPGEKTRSFRGGYHDAADFDVFTYHLRATAQVLAIYEAMPEKFADNQLNIPESGNGLPDLLDEADWALFSYRDNQNADGGVPYGRGNDEDAIRAYERENKGKRPPFGLFPPNAAYNCEYAAVAAQFSRLIRPYDAAKADSYIESARRAYAWAKSNYTEADDRRGGKEFAFWAASEIFATTGDPGIHEDLKEVHRAGVSRRGNAWWRPIALWPYAATTQPTVDKAIQQEIRNEIIKLADRVVEDTEAPAYRVGRGKAPGGNGWGNLNGGGRWADPCIRAYLLTRDSKYLDAIALNADFQLGANPLSKTFITGMGDRHPLHPQISAFLYTGPNKTGTTVKGFTVYGLASAEPAWYPQIPSWRRWRDLGNGSAEVSSEFTITETIGASGMLYSFLYAMEN